MVNTISKVLVTYPLLIFIEIVSPGDLLYINSLSSIILLIVFPSIEVIISPVWIPLEIAGLLLSIWTTYIPEEKLGVVAI